MQNEFIRVENTDNMVRDMKSGAISFINNSKDTREIKRLRRLKEIETDQLKDDVQELKNEMSEIKNLLVKLLDKRD